MDVHVGEGWSDVPPLPKIASEISDLYLRFPTVRSAERARAHVRSSYDVVAIEEPFVFGVRSVEPLPVLRSIIDILTPPERADTLSVLRPRGEELQTVDRLFAVSIDDLRNRLAATWLIQIIRERDVVCVAQPIVEPSAISIPKGYEMLVRGYRSGERVETTRMFTVARTAHLMSQLDALAMQTALATAARGNLAGMIFINCSPAHMHDPYIRAEELAEYARKVGIDPSRVVLEVVETERNEVEHLRSFVLASRRHGFRVAFDDLGAGYSSLTILGELRPDILKFDRGLVKEVNVDPFKAVLLNRLLDASRILGLATVVEGIETEAELAWAAANGATYVQGNFIGKPSPIA